MQGFSLPGFPRPMGKPTVLSTSSHEGVDRSEVDDKQEVKIGKKGRGVGYPRFPQYYKYRRKFFFIKKEKRIVRVGDVDSGFVVWPG